MDQQTNQVLAGFYKLSQDEQKKVYEEITEYNRADYYQKRQLKEDFERKSGIMLGPLDTDGCPCCGR